MNRARFDASHFLVFTAKTDAAIDGHIKHMLREVKGMNAVAMATYKTFWRQWAKKDFRLFDDSGRVHDWAARQAYIALGFAMLAAAERGVDSCPIEGFSVEGARSEEHTSELQSRINLVCRLLLEKKNSL